MLHREVSRSGSEGTIWLPHSRRARQWSPLAILTLHLLRRGEAAADGSLLRLDALHAAQKQPPLSQFSRCRNVFLKEREDFPGKRLSMLARLAAQSLIEVIGNIFDV